MRYVVYGAGAIGATVGAALQAGGHEVVLIARGAHLDALRRDGLRLVTPVGARTVGIEAVGHPSEIAIGAGDVVLLTMKSQDTAVALDALMTSVPPSTPVVCVQNGIANERMALRRFANVYGVFVYLEAQHLEPGSVTVKSHPVPGVLDVGRVPVGVDARSRRLVADLAAAGFASRAAADVMRFKRGKLLGNLRNAVDLVLAEPADRLALRARAEEEALRCFAAAGLDHASAEELGARAALISTPPPVDDPAFSTTSSWQSLVRGTGRVETDYLNGEIALLGRLHDVPTPVNAALQRLVAVQAATKLPPEALSRADVEAAIERERGA